MSKLFLILFLTLIALPSAVNAELHPMLGQGDKCTTETAKNCPPGDVCKAGFCQPPT